MNMLSWLLYLTDVLQNVSAICAISLILSAISVIIFLIVIACTELNEDVLIFGKRQCKWFIPLLIILAILGSLIPSKTTMYLIAGSEFGEQVVTSDTGKEVLGTVKDTIISELNKIKKKNEDTEKK